MKKIIYHINVNAAFLSWEAVFRLRHQGDQLDLREIPSAVGGDVTMRHGINHFSDRKENVRIHQDGSRWEKDRALEDAMPMWADILDQSRMLCIMYSIANLPEKMDPFVKFDVPKHLQEMESELEKCREIAKRGIYPKELRIPDKYEYIYNLMSARVTEARTALP